MEDKISPQFAHKLNAPLSTERLVVEPLTERHAELLFDLMQEDSIYQWIPSLPPKSLDRLKHVCQAKESRLDPQENNAWLNWAVRRLSDGAYVGKLDAEVNASKVATNVGYIFFSNFWGYGYATEATLALTNHLANCGISKMIAMVTEGNEASYRVLEKSEFIRSRIIPHSQEIRGVKYNEIEYVLSIR
jgi:ribosomal-protein-alanine N-acetyltransferase